MGEKMLRKAIREILSESIGRISVVSARKTGIDHKDGFVINLSDGTQDYAPLEGFQLKDSAPGMYGCKLITGVMVGRLGNGKHSYIFNGIDCEEYVEVYTDSIKILDQIS